MKDWQNKIINFWKNLAHGRAGRFSFFGSNARSDWRFLLVCCLIIEIVSIYAGLYVWRAIDRGAIFQVPQTFSSDVETLDRVALDKTIEIYSAREQQFSRVKSQPVTVKDPSI